MKIRILFAAVLILLPVQAFTQNLITGRDLAFAQIAVGGGYESVLNVTNRGTSAYRGTLSLFRSSGQAWSPTVNGSAIANGQMNLSLNPGATAALRITGSGLEVGFGVIRASSIEQTSFLEGTLTYYVKSGDKVVDSIGVQPSGEIYLASIPFEDFNSIALALANPGTSAAEVRMRLYPSDGPHWAVDNSFSLKPNQHIAQYLRERFAGESIKAGRLEIQSNAPILGTALTDTEGQFSSLPLLPAVKAYRFELSFPGTSITGHLSLRFNGATVEGNAVEDSAASPDVVPLQGRLVDGMIEIDIHETEDPPYFQCFRIGPFALSMETVAGSIKMWTLNPPDYAGEGQIILTAIN